jgi:Malectin domain
MVKRGIPSASGEERAELESVLRSAILQRSPSVLRIAEYIARTYLEGAADDIKEYNIAVDALGRPVDFDPKRDSIVRVEVHRLRKKIETFYRTEGADHAIRLVIDPGKYVPRFEQASPVMVEPVAEIPAPPPPDPMELPAKHWFSRWALLVPLCAVLALAAWSYMPFRTIAAPEPIFLLAGTPQDTVIIADAGFIMRGDRWFKGGSVQYPAPPLPFVPETASAGQRLGDFDYDIPLAAVPWELRLYFGQRSGSDEEPRQMGRGFEVHANGALLIDAQDPELGGERFGRSMTRVFRDIRPGPDGFLHLSFRSKREPAYVSAIGVSPGQKGSLLPIRMISKTAPWTDAQGHAWNPDREFVTGGKLKICAKIDSGRLDPNVLAGERYGNFSYDIPVSKGTYRLKLYFTESWFGPGWSGGGGIGSRRFDVYTERQPLLQDFDIFRESGHKPLVKEFHGLKTNADGYINLNFVPRVNHAAVNALELTEEPGLS